MLDDHRPVTIYDDEKIEYAEKIKTKEEIPFEKAGNGYCKSCNCKGFIPTENKYCQCGHHYSQHYGIG